MPDIDYLRQAMRDETSDLPMSLTIDRIHRRARGLRTLRRVTLATTLALIAAGVAVSGLVAFDKARPVGGLQAAVPWTSSPSACPTPALGSAGAPLLGRAVETDVTVEGRDGQRYDVVLGLVNDPGGPWFTVAFRNQQTGDTQPWDMTGLHGGPGGVFTAKAKGQTFYFLSSQLQLDVDHVLDIGIYSGAADRITVASEGHGSEAHVTRNAATGWTLFWVQRNAKPIPANANVGPQEYQGPERLTITAYNAGGQPQHTVTGGLFTGHYTQNPRDDSPDPHASPTPGFPCS
jgi:hypothetical protein